MRVMLTVVVVVSMIVTHFACALDAQSAPNHRLGAQVQLPDSLLESHDNGASRMLITRFASTPYERELIRIAERVLPDSAVSVGGSSISMGPSHRWRLRPAQ